MKALMNFCVFAIVTLAVSSGSPSAQAATSAEERLKELNITLPAVTPPVANYVDSVRVGNLLFLAGNTAARDWKYKGKVGKTSRCKKAMTLLAKLG